MNAARSPRVAELQTLAGLGTGMFSLIAHELRTPLAAATSSAELMALRQDQWPAEKRASALARMQSSLGRMERIIEDLSFVERVASGRISREDREARLSILAGEALEACGSAGCNDSVAVHVEEPEPTVLVDPQLFRKALVHLLRYLLPESEGECRIEIQHGARPTVTIEARMESEDAVRRGCAREHQLRSLDLRYAAIIAALHDATVDIGGANKNTLSGSIKLKNGPEEIL